MHRKSLAKYFTASALCFIVFHAAFAKTTTENHFFPYTPRLDVLGNAAEIRFVTGDTLVPVYGNQDGFFYTDVSGKYAGYRGWLASDGIGIRKIVDNKVILGGYVFGDYSHTEDDVNFFVINPGFEVISQKWDFHLNGYFPTTNRKKIDGSAMFASEVGISNYTHFNDHTQFDALVYDFVYPGKGADIIVGRTFQSMRNTRIFGGGYTYFYRRGQSMVGVAVGIEYPFSNCLSIDLQDDYDDVNHNTFSVGVRLTLGGVPQPNKSTLQDHLLDRVYRHLGSVSVGSSVNTRKNFEVDPSTIDINGQGKNIMRQNVWFFVPSGGTKFDPAKGTNNCTFGSPCNAASFNQNNVNSINTITRNVNFYFEGPGNYAIPKSSHGTTNQITYNPGQSSYGRTNNFKLPAKGRGLPIFHGRVNLTSNNTLADQMWSGQGTKQRIGIDISDANNITINNVSVDGYAGDSSDANARGIDITNSTNIQIINAKVSNITGKEGAKDNTGGDAFGIRLDKDANVLIKGVSVSNIQAGKGGEETNSEKDGNPGGTAFGIGAENSGNVVVENSVISNITGGDGGNGPDIANLDNGGGDGGDAVGIQGATQALNNQFQGNFTGGKGGDASITTAISAGKGGDGGRAVGIQNTNNVAKNTFSGNFEGGKGGLGGEAANQSGDLGGNGGKGGDVEVIKNVTNAYDNTFSGKFTGGEGNQGGAGLFIGSKDGNGGAGGTVYGIKNATNADLNTFTGTFTGGKGGGGTDFKTNFSGKGGKGGNVIGIEATNIFGSTFNWVANGGAGGFGDNSQAASGTVTELKAPS